VFASDRQVDTPAGDAALPDAGRRHDDLPRIDDKLARLDLAAAFIRYSWYHVDAGTFVIRRRASRQVVPNRDLFSSC
jgi:hypothetical protein